MSARNNPKNKFFFFILISAIILTLGDISFAQKKPGEKELVPAGEIQPFKYESKGKRDPFIPLVDKEGRLLEPVAKADDIASGGLRLEGIVYEERGLSYAVINGEIVKAGDSLDDYKVVRIEAAKVVLESQDKKLELELKKEGE